MEKKKIMLFILLILFFSQIAFVLAQGIFVGKETILEPFMRILFGIQPGLSLQEKVMIFCVWLILFLAFADILAIATAFNTLTCWFIGFALAVITANVGWTYGIVAGLFKITGMTAGFMVAIYILISFFAFFAFHFCASWAYRWLAKAKMAKAMAKGEAEAAEAIRGLREIARAFKEGIFKP